MNTVISGDVEREDTMYIHTLNEMMTFAARITPMTIGMNYSNLAQDAWYWIIDIDRSLWIQESPLNAYEPMVWASDLELLQRAL